MHGPSHQRFAKLALALLALASLAASPGDAPRAPQTRVVVRVVDGDTLVLDGGERLRLLGIDAPETEHTRRKSGAECFGRESSEHVRTLVVGKSVQLRFEKGDARDRYGRTLAWVRLEDGTALNLALVREGWARAYRWVPRAQRDAFAEAERAARREALGMWGPICTRRGAR